MGFSTVSAFAILSVAVLLSVGVLYGAGGQYIDNVGDASREPAVKQQEIKNTGFTIQSAAFDGTDTNITIENTGQTTINKDELTLLVDGTYQSPSNYTMTPEILQPTETATISINMDSNRVFLIHDTGLKEGSDVA